MVFGGIMKNIYSVSVIADCEGRSYKSIASFLNKEDAEAFVKLPEGRDMYGGNGSISSYSVYETLEEALTVATKQIITSAMNKLTKQEREVLGFKNLLEAKV